ncbi:hypothetical protein CHS0354_006969 [Potamilus streckersoni]|uniref:Phosphatidic acid phosphatase type 2/haloperoxidase domain-containing protein n=1 Tax=Potamilus streckersoni TaxID=2493646 RepID=A0AAE0RWN0_9BIVA|nr:hypothetical protein CHS0354_006969 [Potamilus streckersoni]
MTKTAILLRGSVDLFCMALVGIPLLIMYKVVVAYKRGFYCDDQSLMHPYKSNTIPTWVAGFVGLVLPSLAIIIVEIGREKKNAGSSLFNKTFFAIMYKLFITFLFGVAVTQLITDIAKYSIGRLRPHFLTVCKPIVPNCTSTTGFITEDICTGTDKDAIEEARLSFPSGHSSISFYCMVYFMVYLHLRCTWKKTWLIRPVLQVGAFIFAYYTALSRISDYMHHWSDVLCGAIIGIIISLLVIFYLSGLYDKRHFHDSTVGDKTLPLYTRPSSNKRLDVQRSPSSLSDESSNDETRVLI